MHEVLKGELVPKHPGFENIAKENIKSAKLLERREVSPDLAPAL